MTVTFDRLKAFIAEAMTRLSLERLCERIVSEHDYDLAVLAQWDGRRRYANMRKPTWKRPQQNLSPAKF